MMKVSEVARVCGVSRRTVARWCSLGRTPAGTGVWSVQLAVGLTLVAAVQCARCMGHVVWLRPSMRAPGLYVGQCVVCYDHYESRLSSWEQRSEVS
jgi:hypothetical protein